jgi:hypothetical protein
MSQHDYQYAHANPVNYTDPTGYFTLGEVVSAVGVLGILTSLASSGGYVGAQYVTGDGITGEEGLQMFDQWVAGFANGVSGGITTAIRREEYGQIQEGEHAFLWNMGNLAGVSASFILGFQVPGAMQATMGSATWVAGWAGMGIDAAGMVYGAVQGAKGLADGKWEYNDVFNLLSLVPFAAPAVASVRNSISTIRTANAVSGTAGDAAKVTGSVDEVLQSSQTTKISLGLGGGFDGHKSPELLKKFSEHVDAPYYEQWAGYGPRVNDPKYLGDLVRKNMENADEIHFNLDGWSKNNYKKYLNKRDRAFKGNPPSELTIFDDNGGYITNWEYHQIITNPSLLNKTTFYDKGGNIRPHDQLFFPSRK